MFPFGILADDLTGACDCGVQFSSRGARVRVLLSPQGDLRDGFEWDVTVINTESRHDSPEEAVARVSEGLAALARASAPLRYKKIDSTLRGPIAHELRPLLDAGMMPVVCPSFPKLGRTVENGYLMVNGVPVHQTDLKNDPLNPVLESHMPTLLKQVLGQDVRLLPAGGEWECASGSPSQGPGWMADEVQALVADAVTEEDLLALAAPLVERLPTTVGVGSAGLAHAMARVALADASPPSRPPPLAERITRGEVAPARSVLIVAGSRNPATVRQVDTAAKRPEALSIQCLPREFDAAWTREARDLYCEKVVAECSTGIDRGKRLLILSIENDLGQDLEDEPDERVLLRSERLNSILGELARKLSESLPMAGLILTGGDTARSVLNALGATSLQLGAELYPGIPLGWILDPPWHGMPVITKSGSFGEEDALVNLSDRLEDIQQAQS